MQRIPCRERDDWQATAEACGFDFHTIDGVRYWDERAFYAFTLAEIEDRIEAPTGEIDAMCRELCGSVIEDERHLRRLRIPEAFWPLIRDSWRRHDGSLYGRLDLSYAGSGDAKLLEYNADTPTSIFEAAVFQWTWLEQGIERRLLEAGADQFNSLHERLIEAWKKLGATNSLHLAGMLDNPEDLTTLAYLEDTAKQAGLETTLLAIENIGWREASGFVDLDDEKIALAFKLYPWEWMFHDAFGEKIAAPLPAGSSRRGKPFCPTRACWPCCGRCFRATPICCRPSSKTSRTRKASAPPLCASRYCRAKAPMSRSCVTAMSSPNSKVHTGLRALFARRWRRCRIFPANIPCSEAGLSIMCLADCLSVRTKIRSRATHRAFCRTRFFEKRTIARPGPRPLAA
jgi:Glutathionylspermidine synthase preATP-grasp